MRTEKWITYLELRCISSNHVYKDHKILKFTDILKVQNCLFMHHVEQNNALATSFPALHPKGKYNNQTISATRNLLDVLLAKANKYGEESVKYQCIRDWNNFKKKFPKIPENKLFNMKIKTILKQAIFDQYWTFYSPPSISICAPCIIFTFYLQGLFDWHHTLWFYLCWLIFIVNRNFKLLNQHSILLLLSFVLLPFAFCSFF